MRPLGLTKKGKPYLTCNDCGIQVFFRGKEGIRRLRRMRGYEELSGNVAEFEPVLDYFTSLRCRLREIRREKPLLGSNSDLDLEEKIVEQEMERLRGFLKDGLKRSKQQSKKLDAG